MTITLSSLKQLKKTFKGSPSYSGNFLVGDSTGKVFFAVYGFLVSNTGITLPYHNYGYGKSYKSMKVSYDVAEKLYEKLKENPLTEKLLPDNMEEAIKTCVFTEEEFKQDWGE